METGSNENGYGGEDTGWSGEGKGSVAGDGVERGSSNIDDSSHHAGIDYRRLIKEQRHELEELKRAAREASPSRSSSYPPEEASALQLPPVPPAFEPQQQPLPPVPSSGNYSPAAGEVDGTVRSDGGDGGRGGAINEPPHGLPAGRSKDFNDSTTGGGVEQRGAGAQQQRYGGFGVGGDFLAAVSERRKTSTSDGINVGIGIGGSGGDGGREYLSSGDYSATSMKKSTDWDDAVANGRHPNPATTAGGGVTQEGGTIAQDMGGVSRKPAGSCDHFLSWWQEDGSSSPSAYAWEQQQQQQQQQQKSELPLARRIGFRTDAAAVSGKWAAGEALETPTNRQREAGNSTVRFARRRDGKGTSGGGVAGSVVDHGPSTIAEQALASHWGGHRSVSTSGATFDADNSGGGYYSKPAATTDGTRVNRGRTGPYSPASTTNMATATVMSHGIQPVGSDGGGGGGGIGVESDVKSGKTDAMPPPLEAVPTTAEPPRAAYTFSPRASHAEGVSVDGFSNGRGGILSAYRSDAKGPDNAAASFAERGGAGGRISGARSLVGGSWGVGGDWGGIGSSPYDCGLAAAEGRQGGGTLDSFRSASWAEKLVTKREEQSVLVRQLERELASTVSALRDERREKRAQTEALKSRLDKAKGTLRDREAELERRERMTTTLMAELEALRVRCDRLSESREEGAEEADKTITRFREDNRELEARLRQADAAAAEARAARAGADAERVRMERDLQSALAKVASVQRKAEEEAEAATAAADEAARELRDSKGDHERLRSELKILRKRVAEEQEGGTIGSLRAQVADLDRLLETSNQRCVALEARLALLEKELVEAEGSEVEARARLRWALGQLGNIPAAAAAAAAAASDSASGTAGDESSHGGGGTENAVGSTSSAAYADGAYSDDPARPSQTAPREITPPDLIPREPSRSQPRPSPPGGNGVPEMGGPAASALAHNSADIDGYDPVIAVGRYGSSKAETAPPEMEAGVTEEDEETKYREPNWRSMVPVLFPPGWRNGKGTAAKVEAAGAGEGNAGGKEGALETGAATERDVVETGSTVEASSRWDDLAGVAHERLDVGTTRDGGAEAGAVLEQGTGGVGREQNSGGGGGGGDAGVGGATRTRARPQREERGTVWPAEEADDGMIATSEGRLQATLDHLTAEERSFAYAGGGQWCIGENNDEQQRDEFYMHETAAAANGDADLDSHHITGHGYLDGDSRGVTLEQEGRGTVVPHGIVRGDSRRRRAVPAERGARVGPGAAPKGTNNERGVNLVARRSQRTAGAQGAPGRGPPSGGATLISPPNLTSSGRPGRRLSVRVPVPRGPDSTPGYGTGAGRPPSHPRHTVETATILRASVSATRQRRVPSRSPSTMPNGLKRSSSGGRGSGGGVSRAIPRTGRGTGEEVPLQRSKRRPQSAHPRTTAGKQEQPAEGVSAVVRRRTVGALVARGRGIGSRGDRLVGADGVSLDGATTKKPTRRQAGRSTENSSTTPGFNSVEAGAFFPRREMNGGGSGSGGAARRGPKSVTGPAGVAKMKPAASFGPVGAGLGGGGAREYVSLMRKRRERGANGSNVSSSHKAAGGGGDRRLARGRAGLSGGFANSSICSSSRAWKP
ncbi:unnamed protein product [Pylaiella littoralis]